jgi:transposase
MADFFLLSKAQMRRIEAFFPLSHGIARVDDRRIASAIVFVIRNGLRWRDAPVEYGPHKTIYNRSIRWSRLGVFYEIFAELARKGGKAGGPRTRREQRPSHCFALMSYESGFQVHPLTI